MGQAIEKQQPERVYVEKLWGREEWIENTPGVVGQGGYCAKFLYINPGYKCSLHYHPVKAETFYPLEGEVLVEIRAGWPENPEDIRLFHLVDWKRNSLRIPAGTPHRFWALEHPARLLEISTYHSDEDVVRLEESRKI